MGNGPGESGADPGRYSAVENERTERGARGEMFLLSHEGEGGTVDAEELDGTVSKNSADCAGDDVRSEGSTT